MAVLRPFRALVYSAPRGSDISTLTAPPYDVVSPDQRRSLLAVDSHNVVALELPEDPPDTCGPGNRYDTGAALWRTWRDEGVIVADESPALYVLDQRWTREGRAFERHALVGAVELEPFSAGVILPHERTLPKALDDRLALTRACAANLSQVLGLYSDPAGTTDRLFEEAVRSEVLFTATDTDGVESRLHAIRDPATIEVAAATMSGRPVFIADGHHRYSTALACRDERRAEAGAPIGTEPDAPAYDHVMMALVNMDDPGLVVMPSHRVADADGAFDAAAFWAAMERRFDIEEPPPGRAPTPGPAPSGTPTFLIRTGPDGATRIARLKADADLDEAIPGPMSHAWKRLDVTVLQELVLGPLLGIHPDRPATLDRLTFVNDANAALGMAGEHDAVFVLNPTPMDQMRNVALAGETMPQKSTYFYPKVLSGMLFRSLE